MSLIFFSAILILLFLLMTTQHNIKSKQNKTEHAETETLYTTKICVVSTKGTEEISTISQFYSSAFLSFCPCNDWIQCSVYIF